MMQALQSKCNLLCFEVDTKTTLDAGAKLNTHTSKDTTKGKKST